MKIISLVSLLLLTSFASPTHSETPTPTYTGKPAPAMPGVNVPSIKVNSVGYLTGWTKMAVFNVNPKGAVVKDAKGQVAYRIQDKDIHAFGLDPASQDQVWQVDFSALTKDG